MARRRTTKSDAVEIEAIPHTEPEMEALQDDLQGQLDDEFNAEINMLNDPSVSHLPDASPIGGQGWSSAHSDTFAGGSSSVGRSTSAPMFEHAAAFSQAKQMRVWEVKEGVPHALGVTSILSSEEEFVRKYIGAMPGKFLMRPIDINGRYVGQEMTTVISANHAALRGTQNGTSPVSASTPQSDMMMEMLRLQREEIQELRLKMDDERSTIGRERMELAEERTALATNAAMGVQSVAERMMQSDQARQDQINNTLTGLFQQQMQMMTAQAESDRQRARQRLDEMKAEQTYQMERERDRLAREREKERDWHERKEKERMRQIDKEREESKIRERLRKAEMDASLVREREHAERMMQMNKTESGIGGAKKILAEFGMKPVDVLELIRGGSGDDGGEASIGTTIVKGITEVGKSFADAAKANVEAQASVQASQAQAQAQIAQMQALQNHYEEDFAYEDGEGPEMAPQAALPPPEYSTRNPDVAAAFSHQEPTPPAPAQPQKIALPLAELKQARKAVRAILQKCNGAPEEQWQDFITEGIIANQATLIPYIQAASIRRALTECGATPDFAARLISIIDKSGLVPDSIPRG